MKEAELTSGGIWSIPSHEDNEDSRRKRKSKSTIIVCSIILLGVTAALSTWLFVVRPNFYPHLKIMSRAVNEATSLRHHISRRSEEVDESEFIETGASVRSKVETKKAKHGKKHEQVAVKPKTKDIFDEVGEGNFPYKSNRLPRSLLPTDYYIKLDVDLKQDSYTGEVTIDLICKKNANFVIFHGRKIRIKDVSFASAMHSGEIKVKRILFLSKNEMYLVETTESFQKGKEYAMKIEFESDFNPCLAGFYKSHYRAQDGSFRTIATSHFEPTDARAAFPSLDEPNFKAKFHIAIKHRAKYSALSNMPVESTRDLGNGWVEDTFQESVRMSTYLVAFAVVDFKYKEAKTDSGIKVRVYAPEGDYDRIDYPLEVGAKVISFYEKVFGAPYPLPKLDLLSVPDFLAGAMEDWGLVSFRSSYLIYDKEYVTLDQKKMITLVIAHELAHQWFGNLVTMKWWNDIWLNEGFANYVEMLGTNAVNKEFKVLDLQVPTGWQAAMSLDSLQNSHPIDQEVATPSEIDELFDAISYNKGAALLRMLKAFLGNDFFKGVRDYIQNHKFGNAETDDLWRHLKKADHTKSLKIKNIMDTWSKQSGFPVVTVNKDGNDLVISQKSILLAKAESKKAKANEEEEEEEEEEGEKPKDLHWHIPFTYFSDVDPKSIKAVWMNNETRVRVPAPQGFKWLKGNANNDGYYVVNYDDSTWRSIARQLKNNHEIIPPVDRAGLIHDAFKLACDGIIDPLIPLKLTKYLKKEKHYLPWAMARAKLDCVIIQNKKIKKLYKKYFWYLMSHLVDKSMLDARNKAPTDPYEVFQRFDTFSFVMKYNFRKDFKEKLGDLFQDIKNNETNSDLSAELRALAMVFGSDPKDDEDFDFLWQSYVNAPLDAERRFIMKAFSRVKDKKKLQMQKVRVQDTIPLMMTLVKLGGRKQVWEFIENNFDGLAKRYGGRYQLGSLVAEVAGGFYKKKDYERVKKFISTHSLGEKGSRTEKQVLEKMKTNVDKHSSSTAKTKSEKIEKWIKKEIRKLEGKVNMNW
eukprot:gene7813-13677_t